MYNYNQIRKLDVSYVQIIIMHIFFSFTIGKW